MTRSRFLTPLLILAAAFVLSAGIEAGPASVSLSGAVYQRQPQGDRPSPIPQCRVYLLDAASGAWIGPVPTDSYGRFAFYDLRSGGYVLKVFKPRDGKRPAWQQQVTTPSRLPPIVLP